MANNIQDYTEAMALIRQSKPSFKPKMGMILGSGCGKLAEQIDDAHAFSYAELPGFSACSVKGHSGVLHCGQLHGVEVMCFQGRNHWYEGSDEATMRRNIELMHQMGCESVLLTNAVGSLRVDWPPGQLVLIKDHINLQGKNPLNGMQPQDGRSIFVGLDQAYDAGYRQMMLNAAEEGGISLSEGVYLATLGPSFETPSEIKAFSILGADVVGMSTVSEVITARHYNMSVVTVSMVTNPAAGMNAEPLSHEQTLAGAQKGVNQLCQLVSDFIKITADQAHADHKVHSS